MSLSIDFIALDAFRPFLRNLDAWLVKAEAVGEPDRWATAQLAPDMFPLPYQVQLACHHARAGLIQLTGQPAEPFVGIQPGTLEAMRQRIAETQTFLDGFDIAGVAGAETKQVTVPGPNGITFKMTGAEFLRDWALANFHFHVVTAYAILRHNGVALGKADFIAQVGKYMQQG